MFAADTPTEDDRIRLLVNSWAALRAGTLTPDQQASLEREHPQWQCEAANLIAEGILAYVVVEMVEPELAHNSSIDPHATPSPDEFAARLGAHMLDFVDYRDDLSRIVRSTPD